MNHRPFLYSREYYTAWGCLTDLYWLRLNTHLATKYILAEVPRATLIAMAARVGIDPRRLRGFTESHEAFVEDLLDEVIRIGQVIPFVGKLGEPFAYWVYGLMRPGVQVFLSHTKRDPINLEAARRIRDALVTHGFAVWFDEQSIIVGDSIPEAISRGIENSDAFLMILTQEYLQSEWVKREVWAAVSRALATSQTRVIPCLFQRCAIPTLVADLKYADFRDNFREGFLQLRSALEAIGKAKDATATSTRS
jgi:hypothetical protein